MKMFKSTFASLLIVLSVPMAYGNNNPDTLIVGDRGDSSKEYVVRVSELENKRLVYKTCLIRNLSDCRVIGSAEGYTLMSLVDLKEKLSSHSKTKEAIIGVSILFAVVSTSVGFIRGVNKSHSSFYYRYRGGGGGWEHNYDGAIIAAGTAKGALLGVSVAAVSMVAAEIAHDENIFKKTNSMDAALGDGSKILNPKFAKDGENEVEVKRDIQDIIDGLNMALASIEN